MLNDVIKLLESCRYTTGKGTLFCKDYTITDADCLDYLYEKGILLEPLPSAALGDVIDLELSLVYLNGIGYYQDVEAFIRKNKYEIPSAALYIETFKKDKPAFDAFWLRYKSVVGLVQAIKNNRITAHGYTDVDTDNCILFSEECSVLLPFLYTSDVVNTVNPFAIQEFSQVLHEETTEKQLMFVHELVTQVSELGEERKNERFEYLLLHFDEFYEKCKNAYQFYLSKFSFHKLKIELDAKALEFTQKIQAVINESQTKLIAIPAAFTLSIAAFDFKQPTDAKNMATIPGLVIFALLMQLFINNQKSTLRFIKENIVSYKEIFNAGNKKMRASHQLDITQVSSKFALMEKELTIQRSRLRITEVILWAVPLILVTLWCVLMGFLIAGIPVSS